VAAISKPFDMRLPLTFSVDDRDLIGRIICDVAEKSD